MNRRRLPIGLQAFGELRDQDCYYVDKTGFIARLLDEGKHYFLSRPRRFGKSLLVDTLKELFEGNEPLFEGLHIHPRWDWSVRHPVLRLTFGGESAIGTTVTTGEVPSGSTTPTTSCCCSTRGSSRRTGSRPARRRFLSIRCCSAG